MLDHPAAYEREDAAVRTERNAGPAGGASRPPRAPLAQVIDFDHLARMTLGEHDLEREVLKLFDLQAATLLPRMRDGTPQAVAALAHTLCGSARGIGAWKVSEAAEALERAAREPKRLSPDDAIGRLSEAVAEAHAAIAQRLHAA